MSPLSALKSVVLLLALIYPALQAQEISIPISNFSSLQLSDWQQKSFKGETQYQIISIDKQAVVQAKSTASASSLYKQLRIDLHKTPYLNWSWRIDKKLAISNEQSKQGDDFVARIYLISENKWFFWKSKAINYVWANSSPKNTIWPNPFAGEHVMMLAVRSGDDAIQQWHTEKRNVLKDLNKIFGEDIRYIDATAIMTDTDNSSGTAHSYYANIYFSAQ
ncbi:MAG: DUF3047 domain-containing protein [Methyloprofundus sp.]|nr:DUF3047 domain-containing protein [Methyloprofundus sp.]MBW6453473.1 DUF3047 domain-containing protein [Methyloprofundus sp.]